MTALRDSTWPRTTSRRGAGRPGRTRGRHRSAGAPRGCSRRGEGPRSVRAGAPQRGGQRLVALDLERRPRLLGLPMRGRRAGEALGGQRAAHVGSDLRRIRRSTTGGGPDPAAPQARPQHLLTEPIMMTASGAWAAMGAGRGPRQAAGCAAPGPRPPATGGGARARRQGGSAPRQRRPGQVLVGRTGSTKPGAPLEEVLEGLGTPLASSARRPAAPRPRTDRARPGR